MIAMNEPLETIMEAREDFMVSPAGDSEPTFRTAHFLKPFATSIDGKVSEALSSSLQLRFEPKECPLRVYFNGWRNTHERWNSWVDALHLKYEAVWKKVGIFEAVINTKCYIVRNHDLAFGVAEKWCSKTNTFVFPWGEATITLEDVMVLGGYPVLGDPVFTSLQNQEMKEAEQKLILARQEPWMGKKGKTFTSTWIDFFMNSGSDIEHEAFLATWLSMFVFPHKTFVKRSLFPIAILLARGSPIALAPAVLASIYKDLCLLKELIADLTKNPVVGDKKHMGLDVTLESPFYLVQIWVWERFQNLQPEPNLTNNVDTALFRWHKVRGLKIDNVRLALDSAIDDFLWRPYVRFAGKYRTFYPENETFVQFEADLDKELASFIRCTRVSEIVGIDSTIMQYLPHRVSMQFGMDQDVPDSVPVFKRTKAIAWENYCRPISDRNLYFPSRLFEADVTTRYEMWWKQSILHQHDFAMRSARPSNCGPHVGEVNNSGDDPDVPPGIPLKQISTTILGKSYDPSNTVNGENENVADVPPEFLPNRLKNVPSGNSVQDGLKEKDIAEPSLRSLKKDSEGAKGIKASRMSGDKVKLSGIQGERHSCVNVVDLEERISRLEGVTAKLKKARFGNI
ncbi:uncharacterized protein LOC130723866 [Lotus japonicus]|uniref:uncharacterized protein LOC130723866 n=1 Tax=Lotus japonicus TaxID=34305 RepID=UPI00258CD546|nr:uncharacterized protein LOC130723866 [Lotus japonicus]